MSDLLPTQIGRAAAQTVRQTDVTDDASVQRSADHVDAEYGRLGVLVNNAGIVGDVEGARGGPSAATILESALGAKSPTKSAGERPQPGGVR